MARRQVSLQAIGRTLSDAVDELRREQDERTLAALDDLGRAGVAAMQGNAPRSRTGNYAASIDYRADQEQVTVGSKAPHSHLVDKGRSPGKQPPAALIAALLKLTPSEAYVVARAIGRTGTPGAGVMAATRADLEPDVERAAVLIGRAIGELRP